MDELKKWAISTCRQFAASFENAKTDDELLEMAEDMVDIFGDIHHEMTIMVRDNDL